MMSETERVRAKPSLIDRKKSALFVVIEKRDEKRDKDRKYPKVLFRVSHNLSTRLLKKNFLKRTTQKKEKKKRAGEIQTHARAHTHLPQNER